MVPRPSLSLLFPYTTLFRSGEHGSLLDSALRHSGEIRSQGLFGGRPLHEKRAGAAHGLARMPVAAISAFGGVAARGISAGRSEEHTSELQSLRHLVCRLLLE